jgi:hypothetical protein
VPRVCIACQLFERTLFLLCGGVPICVVCDSWLPTACLWRGVVGGLGPYFRRVAACPKPVSVCVCVLDRTLRTLNVKGAQPLALSCFFSLMPIAHDALYITAIHGPSRCNSRLLALCQNSRV